MNLIELNHVTMLDHAKKHHLMLNHELTPLANFFLGHATTGGRAGVLVMPCAEDGLEPRRLCRRHHEVKGWRLVMTCIHLAALRYYKKKLPLHEKVTYTRKLLKREIKIKKWSRQFLLKKCL